MQAGEVAVVVVEDPVAMRAAIALLQRRERMRVAAGASNTDAARSQLARLSYDVALVDVRSSEHSALGLAGDLSRRSARFPTARYTGHADPDIVLEHAVRNGARGFVLTCSPAPLAVHSRQSAAAASRLESVLAAVPASAKTARLDADEHAIVALFAAGLNMHGIARRLVLDPETVRAHLGTAAAKLGAVARVRPMAALVRSHGTGWSPTLVTG